MIFHVLRQTFAVLQTLLQLGVRDVAPDDNGAVQRQTRRNRILGQLRQDLAHRTVKVNVNRFAFTGFAQLFRDVFPWVAFQFFDPDTVAVDLRFDVAIRRTGDAHSDRARRTVARQTNDADVVGEIFAAELRAEAQVLRFDQQFLFKLNVAERLTVFVPFRRQTVIVFRGRQFDGFQGTFRRGAADDKRNVIRRTGSRAERAHLLDQIVFQLARREQRFGFLIQIGFVGRTATFGDAQEFVLVAVDAVEVNLRWQVGARIHLFVHIQRRILRIAQVIFDVGVIHAMRQRGFVAAAGPDALAFFAGDDRRAGVLTGRQNAFRSDIGVTQELQRDVFVVFAGLRIAQDIGNLLLMRRTQHKGGIVEGVLREQGQRLGVNF
ncbi:hypothetical protein D3C72_1120410 [compost metagenome]